MKVITRIAIAAIVLGCVPRVRAQEETGGSRLDEVAREMKVASEHLGKKATDKPPQKAQENAVAKLDELIVELEKKRRQMGQGSTPNPTIPANESTVRNGPGGMGDLHGVRPQGDRWGELPAHERDRILQSLTEGFPPHYQAVLEAYYKRLAVEKRAEEPEPMAVPKAAAPMKATTPPTGKSMAPAAATKMTTPANKTDK